MGVSMIRIPVEKKHIDAVLDSLRHEIQHRIEKHGDGAFASPHECLGVLREEYREYEDEVIANDLGKQADELIDTACVAIWGVASIDAEQDHEDLIHTAAQAKHDPEPIVVDPANEVPF